MNHKILLGVSLAVLFSLFPLIPQNAFAASFTAAPGGGDWNTGSTWIGGVVPGNADNKIIPIGVTVTITTPVVNSGTIDNHGTINIQNSGSTVGLDNSGTINNYGTINIQNIGTGAGPPSTGIRNSGSINNLSSGIIVISNTPSRSIGISNSGIIDNYGIINVQNSGGVGISNDFGTINNQCQGTYLGNPPDGNPVNYISCIIGGKLIPIETTALLLASVQPFSWMIPVVLSVTGIALFAFSTKPENS